MNIKIRLENENDFKYVENMTREAFWNVYKPGCDEHLMVRNLRKASAFIKELDFVACDEEIIVGNVIYSKAKVINDNNLEFEVLCMGPLSVLNSYQGKGIGTLLMKHSISVAKTLGYNAVFIFGNPKYYHHLGFENAIKYNIQTSFGENFEEFMALELFDGALNGISGKYYEDSAFEIFEEELFEFEKQFPYKEKHILETERLIIRGFKADDFEDLYEYLSDEEVVLYEPYEVFSEEACKKEAIDRADNESFLAVCLKDSGKLIGNLYFHEEDFNTWELGYVFNKKYWKNGYATESAKGIIDFAINKVNARRIIAMCNPDNVPSWKLMERLGMRREGHLIKNIYFKVDGKGEPIWSDTYEYGILSSEIK